MSDKPTTTYLVISPTGALLTPAQCRFKDQVSLSHKYQHTYYFPRDVVFSLNETLYKHLDWEVRYKEERTDKEVLISAQEAYARRLVRVAHAHTLMGDVEAFLYTTFFKKGPYAGFISNYACARKDMELPHRVTQLDHMLRDGIKEYLDNLVRQKLYTKAEINDIKDRARKLEKAPRTSAEGDSSLDIQEKGMSI